MKKKQKKNKRADRRFGKSTPPRFAAALPSSIGDPTTQPPPIAGSTIERSSTPNEMRPPTTLGDAPPSEQPAQLCAPLRLPGGAIFSQRTACNRCLCRPTTFYDPLRHLFLSEPEGHRTDRVGRVLVLSGPPTISGAFHRTPAPSFPAPFPPLVCCPCLRPSLGSSSIVRCAFRSAHPASFAVPFTRLLPRRLLPPLPLLAPPPALPLPHPSCLRASCARAS